MKKIELWKILKAKSKLKIKKYCPVFKRKVILCAVLVYECGS